MSKIRILVDFTKPISKAYVPEPNYSGTGTISMQYNLTDEEITSLKSRAKNPDSKYRDNPSYDILSVKGCININQENFSLDVEIKESIKNTESTYNNIKLSNSEYNSLFTAFIEAFDGEDNLMKVIRNIQLGAEKERERIIDPPSKPSKRRNKANDFER